VNYHGQAIGDNVFQEGDNPIMIVSHCMGTILSGGIRYSSQHFTG